MHLAVGSGVAAIAIRRIFMTRAGKGHRYNDLGKLWKESRPQEGNIECYTEGCSAKCSRNHLLQQNGILTQISDCNHLQELRTNRFKHPYYSFKRIGYEKAMTMYGYCPKCDYELFSPIEVPEPKIPETKADFCCYSLRPIAHEIRKKEGNVEFMKFRDGRAQKLINSRGEIQLTKWKAEQFMITSLKSMLYEFTKGLTEDIPVRFVTREIPYIEVCASSLHIRPSSLCVSDEHLLEASKLFRGLNYSSVNIFSLKDVSFIIYGTHEQAGSESHKLMDRIRVAEIDELTMLVSNMLIAQIEDWCISDRLYKKLPSVFEKTVTKAKSNQYKDFDKDYGINLFDL